MAAPSPHPAPQPHPSGQHDPEAAPPVAPAVGVLNPEFWRQYPEATFVHAVHFAMSAQAHALRAAQAHEMASVESIRLQASYDGLNRALTNFAALQQDSIPSTDSSKITQDELLAVGLYTDEAPSFCFELNRALRNGDQAALAKWKPLARLLFSGLSKLPKRSYSVVWRVVDRNLRDEYPIGSLFQHLVSASLDESYIEAQAEKFSEATNVTVIRIENAEAISMRGFSVFPTENEVLLLPGTEFIVKDAFTARHWKDAFTARHFLTIAIKHHQPIRTDSFNLVAYNMLSQCRDAYSFWREDNDFKDEVSLTTLLPALHLYALKRKIMAAEICPMAIQQFGHKLSPNGKETVALQQFAVVLHGHQNLTQALLHFASSVSSARINLRDLLAPAFSGEDLARLQQAYLPGTRQWVFRQLEMWMQLPHYDEGARIFWLQGAAGMGKSVLAQQIVARYAAPENSSTDAGGLAQKIVPPLVAYFFCKHYSDDRNDPRRVVATLAFHLTNTIPDYKAEVLKLCADARSLRDLKDMMAGEKGSLQELFDALIAGPLETALIRSRLDHNVFILIDALDELQAGTNRQQLLALLARQLPSLPLQARMIITSRRDSDLVDALQHLQPFVLTNDTRDHLEDARRYIRERIVEGALRIQGLVQGLAVDEREKMVEEILVQSGGTFLTLKLMGEYLQSVPLSWTLDLLKIMLSANQGRFNDFFYHENMERALRQVASVVDGTENCEIILKRTLQILVTAKEPLRRCDVLELVGHESREVAAAVMKELSTFFHAESASTLVIPVHKTVFDFLTNCRRATEKYFVNVVDGHAWLACSSLDILRQRGLLPGSPEVIERDSSEIREPLVQYALRYGHMHLKDCLEELSRNADSDSCQRALGEWRRCFTALRGKRLQELNAICPPGYSVSADEATAAFGAWLLLQAYSCSERRRNAFQVELNQLAGVCGYLQALRGGAETEDSFLHLMPSFSRLYGQYWTSWSTADNVRSKASKFIQELPLTSLIFESGASEYLQQATDCHPATLVLPRIVGLSRCLTVLQGHSGGVSSVAISRDDSKIVSAGEDNTVRVWDTVSGACLQTLQGHSRMVLAVTVSCDGSKIVSGSEDKSMRLWDAAGGTCMRILQGHSGRVLSVALNRNCSRIVSGSDDKTIGVWDVARGVRLQTLKGHSNGVRSIAVSVDGCKIVSGSDDKLLRVWDAVSGDCLRILHGHGDWVRSVAIDERCSKILSGSYDKTVRLWDAVSGTCVQTLQGHSGYVWAVALIGDGSKVVSGSTDKTVRVWDAALGNCLRVFDGHDDYVNSIGVSGDGSKIVSGSRDKTIRVWDAVSGARAQTLNAHGGSVFSAVSSEDGSKIVSGSHDKTIRVWNATNGVCLLTLLGHSGSVLSVALTRDGSKIVSGSDDKTVRMWDAVSGSCLHIFNEHSRGVNCVVVSQDSTMIVSGSDDATVRVWDPVLGGSLQTLRGHRWCVRSVALSEDKTKIVSGSGDTTVCVWDAISGDCLHTLRGHSDWVCSVALSADGAKIVSGSKDATARVWDVQTGVCVRILQGHSGCVWCVATNGDWSKIVSAGEESTVRVWDTGTWECLCTLQGHGGSVLSVAISRDGSRIVSGGTDATVRVWPQRRVGR